MSNLHTPRQVFLVPVTPAQPAPTSGTCDVIPETVSGGLVRNGIRSRNVPSSKQQELLYFTARRGASGFGMLPGGQKEAEIRLGPWIHRA
jgi:hypothetical protein